MIQAIVGDRLVTKELLYGGVSCVFWTLFIVSTVKYVILALNADNNGEGGIFALYARVRRYNQVGDLSGHDRLCDLDRRWIHHTTGLHLFCGGRYPCALSECRNQYHSHCHDDHRLIICISASGYPHCGPGFWSNYVDLVFNVRVLGLVSLMHHPAILQAINPRYAVDLLTQYPKGFWLLGSVFLCTTGAEALYSDLGHCGKTNIRISWGFVWIMLLLNYFGQSAWVLSNFDGQLLSENQRIFYALMPSWFLPIGLFIATLAAIIASQALISGVFTLVNEAMKLKLWLKMKVNHPTDWLGQVYIPGINWVLMIGCLIVVLFSKIIQYGGCLWPCDHDRHDDDLFAPGILLPN
ncbi:MAG: KUP/HAK/KT family potassium transporter [Saprospiraceae bacterium]|nr:KUP/HAK/KT family potassium transporter [Saprospiraceae bacterium]